MRTLTLLCSLSVLASACAFHPFDLGDSTEGDDGHSRWSVSDGLCPGLGSCGLEVPVAAGATIRLSVDVPDRLLAELRPIVVSGDGVIGDVDRDPEHDQLYFDVSAGGAGTIELAIVDSESEVVDRSRVHVVEPSGEDLVAGRRHGPGPALDGQRGEFPPREPQRKNPSGPS